MWSLKITDSIRVVPERDSEGRVLPTMAIEEKIRGVWRIQKSNLKNEHQVMNKLNNMGISFEQMHGLFTTPDTEHVI
jgi:hypothetical protein